MNIVEEPDHLDAAAERAQLVRDVFPAGTLVAVLVKPRKGPAFVLTDNATDKVQAAMAAVPGEQFWPLDIGS